MVIRTLITNGDGGLQISLSPDITNITKDPPLPCASCFPIPARLDLIAASSIR